MTRDDARASAMLSCLEMVRNGTTTFCDNGGRFEAEINASVAEAVGLRGTVSEVCWDRPPYESVSLGDTDACVARLESLVKRFPFSEDRRIWGAVSMAGMAFCTDELVIEGKKLADRAGVILDMHQSFAPEDVALFREKNGGHYAAEHLDRIGVLGRNLQLVHMIETNRAEIPYIERSGASVVHCPAASLRVGRGVSKNGCFPEMVEAGVNVSLGSDSGNYADSFNVAHSYDPPRSARRHAHDHSRKGD